MIFNLFNCLSKLSVFQEKAAQAIFGAINVKGKLPVTINKDIPVNSSIKLKKKRF